MGYEPEPIFDSVESAVVSTIGAVRSGTFGPHEYDTMVPDKEAERAWEFYGNDDRWGMDWEEARDAAVEAGRVGTDRYEGKEHVGVLA